MSRLPTRPLERNLKLARLGVTAGTQIAAHTVANLFRAPEARAAADRAFYARQARALADELGRLKGSVMKAGQMLSLYGQYFLPDEAVKVLSELQDNTPAVDWPVLAPVLEHALGRERLRELVIDRVPLAAASLGQVHRARRKRDGLELCVKVRYPGVAEAIESDVNTLYRLIVMTRLAPPGLRLEPIFDEVREMLHREVDYETERLFTQMYHERLAADRRFAVPRVLPEYCSDTVLATTYEEALHVRDARVQGLSQERRNRLALAALDLFLTEFFDWRTVQTDPHFGNYRVRVANNGQEDRLVLIDFGATRVFGPGFVEGYADIVGGALAGESARIGRGAEAIGLMGRHFPQSIRTAFAELCELIVEPFRGGAYDWGASDLPRRVTEKIARTALSRWFRLPPREIVFLHRRLAGVYILVATLRAQLDARDLLLSHLART
ncbi:MAG: AarF/ABC1/UbiB kinase family protein [Gammaproteobacteria bacterium]|nr:AarF/ABC1/UbiB kinase family protein [Gammaproteobacteria bacterium]